MWLWVPTAKVWISSSVLCCLCSCQFLYHISRVSLEGRLGLSLSQFWPGSPLKRPGNEEGGNKAFDRQSHGGLLGYQTVSLYWKFTQLRAGPPPPARTICFTTPWERLMCPPQHSHTQRFIKLVWSKERATVQFSNIHCEMKSVAVATSWRSNRLLFYSPSAAYGLPVNLCVGPRSAPRQQALTEQHNGDMHMVNRSAAPGWLAVRGKHFSRKALPWATQEHELVRSNKEWQPATPSQHPLPQNPFCAECKGGSQEGVRLKMSAHEFLLIIVLKPLEPQTL